MKNLAVICPSMTDATSFYRGLGPLGELRRQRKDLSLCLTPEINWATLNLVDGVFLQRPFADSHRKIAEIVKNNKTPLWVDFDDDLFAVPEWNPCYSIYNKDRVQKNIAEITAMADVVSVTTQELADKLAPLNKNIRIIPNALNLRLVGLPKPIEKKPGTLVFWRGSKTHRLDLNECAEACIHAAKRDPGLTFFFIGESPWFADYMPDNQVICAEPVDPIEYHQLLAKLQPNLQIVPLYDCPFNRSKSNIAWIEGTWAGAAVVGPTWWKVPMAGAEISDFQTRMGYVLDHLDFDTRLELNQKAWHHLQEHYTLETVNEQRLTILKELGL